MSVDRKAADAEMAKDVAPDLRARILAAASVLLAEHGVAALTTRSVAAAAGVQPPALYRLFGDKRGLLHAVAEHDLIAFPNRNRGAVADPDPIRDLARNWDDYVAFGVANPAVFAIVNELSTPRSPAAVAGMAMLREQVERIARAGRLGIPVARAVELIHSAGIGTITALLATPTSERDPRLSPTMRDAVLAAIMVDPATTPSEGGLSALAVTLDARLKDVDGLTPGERLLLSELLGRLASGERA